MKRKYGIPYKGSKSKIAEDILESLPAGERLVDLFGGGFAITHCALENFPNKWNSFFYNDIDRLLAPLITDAINGKYSEPNFIPEWISRKEFFERKDSDGYVKWIWSFGNNGNDYLYGKDIEDDKRKIHNLICYGEQSDITNGIVLSGKTITERRLEFNGIVENGTNINNRLKASRQQQHLYQLAGLSRLDSLSSTEAIKRLQPLQSIDYRSYKHIEGDVVYCDIPYELVRNKRDYGGGFNHKEFFDWCHEQPYDIYYSSYTIGSVVWQKEVKNTMNGSDGVVERNEALFCI